MRYLLLIFFSAVSFTAFGGELKGVVMNAEQATIPSSKQIKVTVTTSTQL